MKKIFLNILISPGVNRAEYITQCVRDARLIFVTYLDKNKNNTL